MKTHSLTIAGVFLLICILLIAGCTQNSTQTGAQTTVATPAPGATTAVPVPTATAAAAVTASDVKAKTTIPETTGTSVTTGVSKKVTITDGFGRTVTLNTLPQKVVCSGSGCLRYLTYLQAQDKVVGVDSIETKVNPNDARGYALANPQFLNLPLIGELRGKDNPEKIVALAPELIFKTGWQGTPGATDKNAVDELQRKTKITVIGFPLGSLRTKTQQEEMYYALNTMGLVMGKEARAKEIENYIEATIADLNQRTKDIPDSQRKSAYIAAVAMSGAHGVVSTEPAYAPFRYTNVKNIAEPFGTGHIDISKEYLVNADPEYIFVDLSTIQDTSGNSAIDQLKNDPAYQKLTAVKQGKVYGVIPYIWYAENYENVLADAYFIGKVLYPDQFADVDPVQKANEITTFFDGKPMYDQYQKNFNNMVFKPITL